jgi:hypothetical protein
MSEEEARIEFDLDVRLFMAFGKRREKSIESDTRRTEQKEREREREWESK